MTMPASLLERFDSADGECDLPSFSNSDVRVQQKIAAAYNEGVAAGRARAEKQRDHDSAVLATLDEKLNHVARSFEAHLENELLAALIKILSALLPTLARAGFAEEAASIICSELETSDRHLTIRTSPINETIITKAINEAGITTPIDVQTDKNLSDLALSISREAGGFDIDLDKSIKACLAVLENAQRNLDGEGNNK